MQIEEQRDGKPWYFDIKQYVENKEYPPGISDNDNNEIKIALTKKNTENQIIEYYILNAFNNQSNKSIHMSMLCYSTEFCIESQGHKMRTRKLSTLTGPKSESQNS